MDDTALEAAEASATPEGAEPSNIDQEATSTPETQETVEAQDPESPPESVEPEDEKPKSRAQERIEQLAAEKNAAKEVAEYWRNRALEQAEPPEPPKDDPRPTLEQFEYDQEAFAEALVDWADRQIDTRTQAAVASTLQAQSAQSEQSALDAQFAEKTAEFAASNPDFETVVTNPNLPLSESMLDVAKQLERGPDVLYHLGKNPNEAARIAAMSPGPQAAALGRIEASLTAPKPQLSKAPEPPNPVGGGQTSSVSPEDMSIDEWMKWRAEGLRSQSRR